MNGDALRRAARRLEARGRLDVWTPLPHQRPPEGDWLRWWTVKGRGAGGTSAVVRWVWNHCNGPACDGRVAGGHRGVLFGPTSADVTAAMVNGPAGLKMIDQRVASSSSIDGHMVVLPGGARLRVISGRTPDSVERFRAEAGLCFVAIDEASIIPHLAQGVELAEGSLRLGPAPRLVASTTPARRQDLRDLIGQEGVEVTHGRTADNPYLSDRFRERLSGLEGTDLGREQLDAEWLPIDEGPMWARPPEVRPPPRHLGHVAVVIDPAGSGDEGADETGIVVVGVDLEQRLWVLDDRSARLEPDAARDVVWSLVDRYRAATVIYEENGGKNWIRATLLSHPNADARMLEPVWQDESKADRFEPVARLYWPAGGGEWRVVHAGPFPHLVAEMLSWRPGARSPNRLDAVATGLTWLVVHRVGVDHYRGLFDAGRPSTEVVR